MEEYYFNINQYDYRNEKWYNNYRFPLVPRISLKKADSNNTIKFNFDWLFIKSWSRDGVGIEISFVCDSHWGFGFAFLFPYLRLAITIPFPESINDFVRKHFHRHSQIDKQYYKS